MDLIETTRLAAHASWTSAFYAILAVGLVCLLAYEVVRRAVGRTVQHRPLASLMWQRCDWPIRCLCPLIGLQVAWGQVDDKVALVETVRHVNLVLVIAACTWLGIRMIDAAATHALARLPDHASGDEPAERLRMRTRGQWIRRAASAFVLLSGIACILLTVPGGRHIGASLLASAGALVIVTGMAARTIFGNLLAGLQIAAAQPFKIGDLLEVNGGSGTIEDVTPACIVLRLADRRHMRVPMHWFIDNPFTTWSLDAPEFIGEVLMWVDYGMPMDLLREAAQAACKTSGDWNGRLCRLQVWSTTAQGVQVRIQVSAPSPAAGADLCCHVREALLRTLRAHPDRALPRQRLALETPASRIDAPGLEGIATSTRPG